MSPETRFCSAALVTLAILSPAFSGCQRQKLANETAIPKASANSPLAVALSTDCGADIDDQWALAHLLLSPELDLRAIITTHAGLIASRFPRLLGVASPRRLCHRSGHRRRFRDPKGSDNRESRQCGRYGV